MHRPLISSHQVAFAPPGASCIFSCPAAVVRECPVGTMPNIPHPISAPIPGEKMTGSSVQGALSNMNNDILSLTLVHDFMPNANATIGVSSEEGFAIILDGSSSVLSFR